jgi:hypothetical protein
MSAPFPLPALRTFATLPPREADILLALAAHSYRLHSGQSARQGLRRVAAYRCFLKLSPSHDEAESGAADANSMAEHRKTPRKDLFRLGELHPTGWSYPLDCLVREASAHGALIEVGWTTGLPDEFTLTVQSTGMNKRCQVVRRTERCLGVAFMAA